MKKTLFLTILYIVIDILFLASQSQAADYGLSISPPLLRVHIKPGKSITQVFNIQNLSQTDLTLVANIVPFTESDSQGNPLINPKATAPWLNYFSLANSNITLNQPFIVQANATDQLVLSLSVPNTAPLKDLYATLTISTYQNMVEAETAGTQVSGTIGANLLITISSQPFPDTNLRIVNFTPQNGSFFRIGDLYFADNLSPLSFSATVSNEGNFAAETKGIFRLTTNNRPVYLDGILPVNVIAKSKRQLVNTNGTDFEFQPSLTQIGLHQVSLEIKTDNSNTSGTIEIFFFPFKLCLGLVIALLLITLTIKISTQTPQKPLTTT